jgi:hypothetical protein
VVCKKGVNTSQNVSGLSQNIIEVLMHIPGADCARHCHRAPHTTLDLCINTVCWEPCGKRGQGHSVGVMVVMMQAGCG